MAPRSRAEAQEVIDKLAARDAEIRHEQVGLSEYTTAAEKFIKYIWLFGGLIVSATLWTAKVQWESAVQASDIAKLTRYCDSAKETHILDQTTIQAMQNTIVSNRIEQQNLIAANRAERMTDIKMLQDGLLLLQEDIPKVSEMWFLLKHGITNKDNYLRENGRPAPVYPDKP